MIRTYSRLEKRDDAEIAETPTTRLLLACPDRPGLIAAVSGFLAEAGLNIIDADQHSSNEGRFFMRMAFDAVPAGEQEDVYGRFEAEIAKRFEMDFRFAESSQPKQLAIMVSREDHCLSDLLWRWRSGELGADVVAVVSNHAEHEQQVSSLGLPFHHVPVEADAKAEAEQRMLELLGEVDLLVLARYMQVLSADFLKRLDAPAINIHHSFLPAFVGADPYRRAHERGVKLIGATAHYVTEELDAGPIIDQDVTRVSHRDEVTDLKRIGRDIERLVLARAVKAHVDDRVLLDGARTIVF
ncbi:MAG TPA: formyltetrahydrofolate deformylase [Solirubrobacterales bacterium]|nr:formyltetrahydrofolate deformylase [Solirubrobacterales bacterium]